MYMKSNGYILDTSTNIIYAHTHNTYIPYSDSEEDIEIMNPWKPLSTSETLDFLFTKEE